jgi:hypothetical protein
MEEGREGNTIIRKQYSTTCVETRGTPVRRVILSKKQKIKRQERQKVKREQENNTWDSNPNS